MTPAQTAFLAELARYTIDGPIPLRLWAAAMPQDGIAIKLVMYTLDRDTGQPTEVVFSRDLTLYSLPADLIQTFAFEEVRRLVREAWDHELDEWFKRDGARLSDPHAHDEDRLARQFKETPLGPFAVTILKQHQGG